MPCGVHGQIPFPITVIHDVETTSYANYWQKKMAEISSNCWYEIAAIFSLCYLINYIYKSVFAKWFRYHVITLIVIVPLNNRAVYMYFYTLSVLDMEAGNFLPAVWYVRITAYVKTNSVMFFFFYFHYEIVCNL